MSPATKRAPLLNESGVYLLCVPIMCGCFALVLNFRAHLLVSYGQNPSPAWVGWMKLSKYFGINHLRTCGGVCPFVWLAGKSRTGEHMFFSASASATLAPSHAKTGTPPSDPEGSFTLRTWWRASIATSPATSPLPRSPLRASAREKKNKKQKRSRWPIVGGREAPVFSANVGGLQGFKELHRCPRFLHEGILGVPNATQGLLSLPAHRCPSSQTM